MHFDVTPYFKDWPPKDWVTLIASLSAFVFSFLAYLQKTAETKQSRRKQLTDTLKELSEINMKDSTFRATRDKDNLPKNYVAILSDQRRFLVLQASSLAEDLGDNVSPHEHVLIAAAFDAIDFVEDAERHYRAALKLKQNSIDEGMALRSYARFEFRQGQFEASRANYQKATMTFSGAADRLRQYKVETYRRWAELEFKVARDPQESLRLLHDAIQESENFQDEDRRETEVKRTEDLISEVNKWISRDLAEK